FRYIAANWMDLLWPFGLFVGILIVGIVLRRLLFGRLRRWAAGTKTPFDDVVVEALHGPFLVWVLILAIHLGAESSQLPRAFTVWSERVLLALWIISLTLMFTNLSGRLVRTYGTTLEGALPVGTLTELIARLLFGIIGVLALMKVF